MEEICPNCIEEIEEAGKCSNCDGLYCEDCATDENMTCPHCDEENAWEKI